ncbi:MAG: ATP-binding cassette domain-containing protein [Emcibacteraceae bacterium]|nr:ATP-binding cassette domain-containing protein [Emcibacteraceae bacterium]
MLKLDNLSFSYDDNQLFNGLSLESNRGEITSVIGKSGVGKSTLFALISGQLMPEQGAIVLDDKDLTNLPVNKRPIITMFQQESLFPHMTIYENIRFPLVSKYNKARFKNINHKEYIQQILKEVKLEGYENRFPDSLSGGQKQRATLARSLAAKPNILLLDEPFSALNEELKQDLNIELIEIVKKHKIIALKITHDKDEALNYSHNILYLGEMLNCHFININIDKLTVPSEVVNYFQFGILSENQKSYFPMAAITEKKDAISFDCKIISISKKGKISEYLLQHKNQKFKYFSDQLYEREITLYSRAEDSVFIDHKAN